MRFRRTLRFHNLKKPKLRQTWNKYNLYNLSRTRFPRMREDATFFQQKWYAKAALRAYHGEHIPEYKWERMFSRKLQSVVNMPPRYMAQHDGSEQAAGRGSGRDRPRFEDAAEAAEAQGFDGVRGGRVGPGGEVVSAQRTPYMLMTFAPQERRLDIAIFRSLFASSARQARQFCVHGAVKVNGKVMKYPGYQLNPGDMFQVSPERVLYATGATKKPAASSGAGAKSAGEGEGEGEGEEAGEADESAEPEGEGASEGAEEQPAAAELLSPEEQAEQLKQLMRDAKQLLSEEAKDLPVKRKQELRRLVKDARSTISRLSAQKKAADVDAAAAAAARPTGAGSIVDELSGLMARLDVKSAAADREAKAAAAGQEAATAAAAASAPVSADELTPDELERFEQLLRDEEENPYDPSKPYATPWRPRPYMSPFAFIPRYLEVNPNICAAVYLRHPVARQGHAEVPTPYGFTQNQLAFNWYLRRR